MASNPPEQTLATLLQHPALWQARQSGTDQHVASVPSGYPALDDCLHWGGWPCRGSTEILAGQTGIGELSVLLPALSELMQARPCSRLALICPPCFPYAPALAASGLDLQRVLLVQPRQLADILWVSEQLLRSRHFVAVLNWLDDSKLRYAQLRKLQLAAQEGQAWSVSYRPAACSEQASPARLRISLQAQDSTLNVHILKQQGGWAGQTLALSRPAELLRNTLDINSWTPINNVVVSDSFTLPAAGGFHSQQRTRLRLCRDTTATSQPRQRSGASGWRTDQQLAQHRTGTGPGTEDL